MRHSLSYLLLVLTAACGPQLDPSDIQDSHSSAVQAGTPEADAVLAMVNDPLVTRSMLDDDAGLDRRAALNIITHRQGPDAIDGTSDDDLFDELDELDAIKYVGASALDKLLAYAIQLGYLNVGPTDPEAEDRAALALVNDMNVSQEILDDDVGLDRRAAQNIILHRQGADGTDGTSDDDLFDSIGELDAVSYVGNSALDKLRAYAVANGYLDTNPSRSASVIFSPQSYNNSHIISVAQAIDDAQFSIDIAMYSYSDSRIRTALQNAVARGVDIRFVFETANDDRKSTNPFGTKSGRIESDGINVRYVNKIMHHKYMIVDGPRDVAARADTATLISGSGNWSNGAATRYDENTVFLTGYGELNLRYQREFNLLWEHSRDFIADASLPYELSTFDITDADITDESSMHAHFTSGNFSISAGSTTFRIQSGLNTVSDEIVTAIEDATDSIWVASGHLRSRPISQALLAKRQADPTIDIRVYLDGQEYISAWYHGQQEQELEACLDAATTASQIRKCEDKGFYYGYLLGQSNIDVRYKYYSYRWHYSYAAQMHHKYIIIDSDELWTGSYNFSDNAEHNTFENVLVFRGAEFETLIDGFETNFLAIWETNRDTSSYTDLLQEVQDPADPEFPIVFTPMALEWSEVQFLKSEIAANCPEVNSQAFRQTPENHWICRKP